MGNGQSETSQAASSTQTEEKCEEHSLDKGKSNTRNTDYRIKHELEKRTCAAECQTINECSQLNQETGLGQQKEVADMGIKSCKNATLKASKRWDSNTGKVSRTVAAGSTIQCTVTDPVEKGRQTPAPGRSLQGSIADGSSVDPSPNNIESCKQSTSHSFLKTSLKSHTDDSLDRHNAVLNDKVREARCSTQHQKRLSNLAPKFEDTPLLKSQDSSGAKVNRVPQTSHARKEGSITGLTSHAQNIQNLIAQGQSKGAQSQNVQSQVTRVHSQKTSIDETHSQSSQATRSQCVQSQISHVQIRHNQAVLGQRLKNQAAHSVNVQSQAHSGHSIKCQVAHCEPTPNQTPHSQSVQSQVINTQSIPSQASCMHTLNSQVTYSQSMRSQTSKSQRVQDQSAESQIMHSQLIHSQNFQGHLSHSHNQAGQNQNIKNQLDESQKIDIQVTDCKNVLNQVHHSENIYSQVAHNHNMRNLLGRSQNVRIQPTHNPNMNTLSMESRMEKQKILLKKVTSPEPLPVTKKNMPVPMADAMLKMPVNLLSSSRSTFVKDTGLIVQPDVHVSKETGYNLKKMSKELTGGQGDAAPKAEDPKVSEFDVEASTTSGHQRMPSPKDITKQEASNSFKNSALEISMPCKFAEQRVSIVPSSGVSYADALKQKSQRILTQAESEQETSLNTPIGKIKSVSVKVDDAATTDSITPISRCPGNTDLTQRKELLCENVNESWIKGNGPNEHIPSKHLKQTTQHMPTTIHQASALKKTRPQLRARHMLHEASTLKHSKQEVSNMLLEVDATMKTKLQQPEHQLHEANAITQMQPKLKNGNCQLHDAEILTEDQLPQKEHHGLNELNTQTQVQFQQKTLQLSLDINPVKTITQQPAEQAQCQVCNVSTMQQSKLEPNSQHQMEPTTNQNQEEAQQEPLNQPQEESFSLQTIQQQNQFSLYNDNGFNQGTGMQKVLSVSQETEALMLAKQQQVQHELFQARLELDNIQTNIIQAKQQQVQVQKKLHEARTLTQSKQQYAQRKLHKGNTLMQEKAQQKSQEVQHWLQEVSAQAEAEQQQTQEHTFAETPSDGSFHRIASSISEPETSLLPVPFTEIEDNQSNIAPKISLPAGISLPQNSFTFTGNTPKFDWVGSENGPDDHFLFKSPFPKVQEKNNVPDSPKHSQSNESAQNSITGVEFHSMSLDNTNSEILPDSPSVVKMQPSLSTLEINGEVPVSLDAHTVAQDVDSETEVKYTPAEVETMFLSTFPAEELSTTASSDEVLTTAVSLPLGDTTAEEPDSSSDQYETTKLAPHTKPKLKVQGKLRAIPKAQFPCQQKQTISPTNVTPQEHSKPPSQPETKQQKKKKQKKEGDFNQGAPEKIAENQADIAPSTSQTVVDQGAEVVTEKVRTSGRWPSFRVDSSCPNKCNRSLKSEKRLPSNVQNW